ncbi:MAG: hypothetical protein WC549_07570 [Actinomycetota bacterium]
MKFTFKFKRGDAVICVKQREPLANMQPGDTGIVSEIDVPYKKYVVQVDGKINPHNGRPCECYMSEFELMTSHSQQQKFMDDRLKLIKKIGKKSKARETRGAP